jgi:hypothetical protein
MEQRPSAGRRNKGDMMNTKSRWLRLGVVVLALWAPVVFAQSSRTWVSGVGDDVNPCSRTAPCKTFQGAISKTAIGGEIDALDPGGFGAITITKSLTIDGGGGQVASVLVTGSNGIVINAGATDRIILRNLRIDGILRSGTGGLVGINVLSAGQVHIDNVDVFSFATAGIAVAPTANPVSVMIERTRLIQNTVGLIVNGTGAAATARLSDSSVQQNITGLSVTGGGSIISFNNNRLNGNGTDGAPTTTIYQR